MSTEDHKLISDAKRYAPELEGQGRDAFYDKVNIELALLAPQQRTALIEQVDRELQADESSLRQKSQIIALKRHMNQTHHTLLRAKR